MHIKDLITDNATGQMSTSKIGAIIGHGVMGYGFIISAYGGNVTEGIMLAYGAIVVGNATASKIVSMKYAKEVPDAQST